MEAATDNLLRDFDAATQVNTTLPSQNAAVWTALWQFRAAVQLRMALPLTWLEEAHKRMEEFIRFRLGELLSQQEMKSLIGELSSWITDMLFQSEREYVIRQLHEANCLSRVTIYYGENQQKQLAFCPYCGVMNENATTTYSHVRKHLGITFLCGGCYNKIYRAPQHLVQHRRSCHPCLMSKPESSQRSVRNK